jgi:uncharacterized protein YcbX
MLTVSELFIYPVKSLGGIPVDVAKVTERGFQHDRRWMLVDQQGMFFTQRDIPAMALFRVQLQVSGLKVFYKPDPSSYIDVPFEPVSAELMKVVVWEDTCYALTVSDAADTWFSSILGINCRLVYMPDDSIRKVDPEYASGNEITGFSDGYPFLLIGQASLDDLNSRMVEAVPINRFRPNIVFSGGAPFQEDEMKEFSINGIRFYGVKLCARCVITTIDQETALKGKDPLKTLASYRSMNKKVLFGQNLLHNGSGELRIGDELILH